MKRDLLMVIATVFVGIACSSGPPAAKPTAVAAGEAAVTSPAGASDAAERAGVVNATTAGSASPMLGEIRFVFPMPAMTMLPMHIASVQGFDKEEGFTATFIQAPGTTGVRALLAGEVDFSMSAGASLAAAVQGMPIRIVVVHVAKSLFWLYSRPGVTELSQLVGRTLAVDALGGSQDVAARLRLQRQGIDSQSVYFIAMGGAQIPGALIAGAVDAGVIAPPQDIQLQREGHFINHGFLGDDLPSLTSGLATTENLTAQRPALVRAAVRAALKGQRFLRTNRVAVLPLMAEYMSLSLEEAALAYDSTVPHFTSDGRVPPELQERMVRDQVEVVHPEHVPEAQAIFDLRFVDDS